MLPFFSALIIIGLVLLFVSFFFTRKLSDKEKDKVSFLTDKEAARLVENALKGASDRIDQAIDEKLDAALEKTDAATDRETNQKIKEISEYSDSVLDSMKKSHDEIVFMYNMLNEKQVLLTDLTKKLGKMESEIRALKDSYEKEAPVSNKGGEDLPGSEGKAKGKILPPKAPSPDRKAKAPEKPRAGKRIDRGEVLSLYSQGYTENEIAKKTGRGVGEVRLVLGLYKRPDRKKKEDKTVEKGTDHGA